MELVYELTHRIFKVDSILSLVFISRADVLALGNLTKEWDIWKGKCEVMKARCSTLHGELIALHEKIKISSSLQEEVKIHCSPSTLVSLGN